ncbi:hypothetical protein CCHR01_08085 [Colletotrichum chrysophilum]|uniref:Uncharacterized protein n=1 Tax=Colletotrichum chrysophilum TaxID=1836956 RepID=A0AAD9AJI5_9PEZI|nr:hypothetical protein CCHR01_08085 [Colletotrichum chrysophilum]
MFREIGCGVGGKQYGASFWKAFLHVFLLRSETADGDGGHGWESLPCSLSRSKCDNSGRGKIGGPMLTLQAYPFPLPPPCFRRFYHPATLTRRGTIHAAVGRREGVELGRRKNMRNALRARRDADTSFTWMREQAAPVPRRMKGALSLGGHYSPRRDSLAFLRHDLLTLRVCLVSELDSSRASIGAALASSCKLRSRRGARHAVFARYRREDGAMGFLSNILLLRPVCVHELPERDRAMD